MEIVGMTYSQSQTGAYALILGVEGENKRLPIIIGSFEAQAIAIELENITPGRPLTHDLFKRFASEFGVDIKEVIINKFENGIFYSLLVCEKNGEVVYIDSRTSDAVALSLRFGCPIYAVESVINEAGIEMGQEVYEESSSDPIEDSTTPFREMTLQELEELLQKTVEEENYEEASQIRDEIKRRKGEQ